MSEPQKVKIFISWSGDLSKEVAVALRGWLPDLFDVVEPWASDVDIAAGQRGLAQIEAELAGARFGIVVVTRENQHAPWINFEAGALSKVVAGDAEQRVVPLLVDLEAPGQLTGPLSQFQAKVADKDGVGELLRSLAVVAGVDSDRVGGRLNAFWPDLEQKLTAAKEAAATRARASGGGAPERRNQGEMLDEILVHVRALRAETPLPRSASARMRRNLGAPEDDSVGRLVATDRVASTVERLLDSMAGEFGMPIMELERRGPGRYVVRVDARGASPEQAEKFETVFRAQPEFQRSQLSLYWG